MRDVIEFLKEHWVALSSGSFGLIWIIVRLTPSTKDDKILQFLQTIFNFIIPDRKKRRRTPGL